MKTLIHLLEGDIRQIKQNYNISERDDQRVKEMQKQLLDDKDVCVKLGWHYKDGSRILKTKSYLLALENYVSLIYGDKSKDDRQ
jgi:septation ring formation regulator EzrA